MIGQTRPLLIGRTLLTYSTHNFYITRTTRFALASFTGFGFARRVSGVAGLLTGVGSPPHPIKQIVQ